ncbi:efflux RND transporter periplasmic adaptor subunit [Pseudodesulfovibrio cashew]|uniref:Efflux RND transporter periplasmic adaptor subunit n=1 Tax=Pseudodesulfovibrio cashew TaxID=2678688 RepID=A0A6I6JAU8_9BACT|nr:efflux RND transporter periplasmic adaptor subunit [Pseudodesulfovibrio cashew]QGY39845.1 efflux RND transporter periplasmic adaptor subunit [Pseudodesulfovibrio cashew]
MMKRTPLLLVLALSFSLLAACGSDPAPSGSAAKTAPVYQPSATATAERASLPRVYEAVGTVKAQTDTRVEAQVTGRVAQVLVRPGDKVKAGDKLLVLDSRASQTRLERSRQAARTTSSLTAQAEDFLNAAKADFDKSESTYRRMKQLNEQKVITEEELEKAESAYLQAKARLGQAREGLAAAKARQAEASKVVQEAEIGLGYTTIIAQADGEVARRLAEPGDLAFPGKELLSLQTGATLRLEAMVRESLIGRVRIGETLGVDISALGSSEPITGTVDEIEPLADPVTRSFLVKVRLPERPGLYPGMFGRLLIPLGEREGVLVPVAALNRVGQLVTVMVKTEGGWEPVFVRTGDVHGDRIEILSGLSGGETLGLGGTEGR